MRLDKYLADANIGTRNEVKKLIKNGCVTIEGAVITDPGFKISDTMIVSANGVPVSYQKNLYFMLNKPAGYITANDDMNHSTVLDLFPENLRHKISAIGRLDKDTTGLIILTNDGDLNHRLTSPKGMIEKIYLLTTDHPMDEGDILRLSDGITLSDGTSFRPARLEIDSDDLCSAKITITEGKYHEVKRLLKACGKNVIKLKRIQMGSLALDDNLKEGEYRSLTDKEIALLLK